MANMTLGAVELTTPPFRLASMIQKQRDVAAVKTYSSVAVFSWGASIEGVPVVLEWDYLSTSLYASLQTLYEADAELTFDPQDGTGRTFQVEIMDLRGTYFQNLADNPHHIRQKVALELLIISQN